MCHPKAIGENDGCVSRFSSFACTIDSTPEVTYGGNEEMHMCKCSREGVGNGEESRGTGVRKGVCSKKVCIPIGFSTQIRGEVPLSNEKSRPMKA